MKKPPFLQLGDKVGIVCPAGRIDHRLDEAVKLLRSWGLDVELGKTVGTSFHQFAATDVERARDFQAMLDDDSIKAIFAARGGYGTVRMIDMLDFSRFKEQPKWIVGFSDITVLHSHIHQVCGVQTIHGQMPLTIPDATKESLQSLKRALFGERISYTIEAQKLNRQGDAEGTFIGGNLALLINVLGSVSDMDYDGKILFVEDVGEYYYSIDRMFWTLKRAGRLAKLNGLIVGGFTSMKDNKIPFGFSVTEIVMEVVRAYDYPVVFDFPAGHIDNNYSLILGENVSLNVGKEKVVLSF
ncbi:S66 peptidase family protein [Olivibacter sitiensis]|uniref:S66 peptidase family protein n=1 Tax=Olivibacter sitiensis TaxID=376470 RepID=UPI000411F32F|nr:LD-carboxypeptidase [Olivibacter sitiensis]